MRRASASTPHVRAALSATVALALLAGCGDDDDYANNPRPPRPIVVTASVSNNGIAVSPRRFGAGPITLVVTNQTDASQDIRLETDELGGTKPGTRQETGPINPADTASLQADVREGIYKVSTRSEDINPVRIKVGSPRPSAQNDLLQP